MQLTIDKMIYGGNGLGRLPADDKGPGKAVFLPFVLDAERVEAEITEQKPGFARARATKIVDASPNRVAPGCPYFGECGGCHYQHASYEHQLEIKSAVLRETLRRVAKIELALEIQLHPSPPWNYRNRTRLRVRTRPFVLGYNRYASSELLPVEQCPISSPAINRAIAAMWELGRASKVSPEINEIEFFANADDTQMMAELTLDEPAWPRRHKSDLPRFVSEFRAALPEVVGAAVFHPISNGRLESEEIPPELKETFGADHLVYSTAAAHYRVSAGSFFQTNRFMTDALVDLVTENRSGNCALDLYAGTGLFSLMLSRNFREVGAVEWAPFSFHDLKQNSPSNVRCHKEMVERFLEEIQSEAPFDLIVADPPRAGLERKAVLLIYGLKAPRVTYVSCDPATLARDLKSFVELGYRIEEAHLIDLFPQTFHIESVFQLVL